MLSSLFKRLLDRPLLVALLMNVVVLLLSVAIVQGKYSSLDDYFMSSVLTGAYGGGYDVHLYFVNVVYGYFLKPFYVLFPNVGWYAVFQLLTVFASFTAISYVVLCRYGQKLGGMLALLLLVCVSPDFYLHVAFTQCAGISTAAGILLFVVGNDEKKWRYLVWGILFMVAGIVFRKDMFLLGMPTLATILLLCFVRNKSIWKKTLVAMVAFGAVYWGLKAFNLNHYVGNEYEYYAAYQGPRAYFGDGDFYDSENFKAELNERGKNSRDFRYLAAWYFYDNHVFHLDSLRGLIKIAERSRYQPNYVKMPFALLRAFSDSLLRGSAWCWAFLCLTLIFFSNRRSGWIPWISVILLSIPYLYLLLVNRVVEHVVVGVWAYAVVFVLFFISKEDCLEKKQTKSFLQLIALLCIANLLVAGTCVVFDKVSKNSVKEEMKNSADWEAFLEYAKKHPDDAFLLSFDRYKDFATYINTAYTSIKPGSWDNIYSSGYWNIHLPAVEKELQKRGVQNIIRDVKKDNVYVLNDEHALSLVPYYKDHYHEVLEIDTLKSFGTILLLKYREGGMQDENVAN